MLPQTLSFVSKSPNSSMAVFSNSYLVLVRELSMVSCARPSVLKALFGVERPVHPVGQQSPLYVSLLPDPSV